MGPQGLYCKGRPAGRFFIGEFDWTLVSATNQSGGDVHSNAVWIAQLRVMLDGQSMLRDRVAGGSVFDVAL